MCIGGPALIYYVTPSEEELFSRYNPELQRRSLEKRQEKQEDFDAFVGRLKEYSKSEKPSMSLSPISSNLPPRGCCVLCERFETDFNRSMDSMGARRRQATTGPSAGAACSEESGGRAGGGETTGDQRVH